MQSSGHTKKAKERDLLEFKAFVLRKARAHTPLLLDVTRGVVEDFIGERLEHEAPSTVARRFATIKHFCRKMGELFEDYRPGLDGIRGPVIDRTDPPKLSELEKRRLRIAVETLAQSEHHSRRNQLVLELGLRQAMRCQEICDLTMARIDLANFKIRSFRGKGKKFATLPMHRDVHAMIRNYLPLREDEIRKRIPDYDLLPEHVKALFPLCISITDAKATDERSFRMSCKSIWRVVSEAGEHIGVKAWPHILRHTAIKDFYAASERDVYLTAKYARHSNVQTTMQYAEGSIDDINTTLEAMK